MSKLFSGFSRVFRIPKMSATAPAGTPIEIGTQFIATKDYVSKSDLYPFTFNQGEKLKVLDIYEGRNQITGKVYINGLNSPYTVFLHIGNKYYDTDRGKQPKFIILTGSQLLEYAELDETTAAADSPANSGESIKVGDVRFATKDFRLNIDESTILKDQQVKIVRPHPRDPDKAYMIQFRNDKDKLIVEGVSGMLLLANTKKKDPIPIQIGTRLIAIKDYGPNGSKLSFNKGDQLTVATIEKKLVPYTEVIYIDGNLEETYNIVLKDKKDNPKFLSLSEIFEYTDLYEPANAATNEPTAATNGPRQTIVGGKRKSKSFLKKQKKSKRNYMRAMRNFITRKRRKRVVS